jgi:Na+/H+ antiporter NhaD/arsenite permease-like protein
MSYLARPPRGWLYGVLLTIFVFWYSGVLWQSFKQGEPRLEILGGVAMLVSIALTAQQALTNDNYKISGWVRVANVLFLLGLIVFVVGGHL